MDPAPPLAPPLAAPMAAPLAPSPGAAPLPSAPPHKEKKAKKHKKHKRHEEAAQAAGLKLRIKVGVNEEGVSPLAPAAPPSSASSHKKKKKKEKKKKDKEKKHRHHHKEKRKRVETADAPAVPASPVVPVVAALAPARPELPPPAKKIALAAPASPERPVPEAVPVDAAPQPPRRAFLRLLDYILPLLQKRDTQNFFALPVSDKFAPGYSQIIKQPMDFSTMQGLLERGVYADIETFRTDFELMCTNAMTYNTQDTVYYKTAKKLLTIGRRLFTPEKLIPMRDQLPWLRDITPEELGFDITAELKSDAEDEEEDDDDDRDVSKVIEDIREVVRRPLGRFEAIPDDLSSREILEQARLAAQGAADQLQLYRPTSQMGFLRQKPDGSTSLAFLTGGAGLVPGTNKDRPVSLGSLIGKVKQGSGAIQGFREDRRNMAKAIHPLYYGSFSSHGPSYDSTFANLTKEETDMVTTTYGEDIGTQYAESILNFSRNCDYAMFIVDHLLDILTENEHRKTSKYIEERKNLRREDHIMYKVFDGAQTVGVAQPAPTPGTPPPEPAAAEEETTAAPIKKEAIDFDSLKSLSDDGIDMSFLSTLKSQYDAVEVKHESEEIDPQVQLQSTADLIEQLRESQNRRLSQTPPQHFSGMPKPTEQELSLATQVQKNLSRLAQLVKPENVVPPESIKKLLGIPPAETASPT
eukprot:snap_masked-scaffold116_size340332-processed-gene-2.16 protein:Tk07659 transcript:snap_masked-scaffold116_size340332-processed-gene-2.16-mRNA-1 annotation:"bromodomain-containing protein 7 isoform x3"